MTLKIAENRKSHPATIKYLINLAGLSGAKIEEQYELYTGCVYDTMRTPNKAGEEAIADALGEDAKDLWPERYDPDTGQRLSPQPHENYIRSLPKEPSRKAMEA